MGMYVASVPWTKGLGLLGQKQILGKFIYKVYLAAENKDTKEAFI